MNHSSIRREAAGLLIPLLLFFFHNSYAQDNFLSNLQAGADAPLYTTYAAQMERSEFALDEGYHFRYYEQDHGIAFTTDTGGDWYLGFKMGDSLVSKPSQMYRKPVITTSYTDLVQYHFQPFKDIRVNASFLVQSSHYALQDLTIQNNTGAPVDLELISYLRNRYRTFNDVRLSGDRQSVLFNHQELPDGWVLGHDVPYVANVKDVFSMSKKPDKAGSFHRYKDESFHIPHQVDLRRSQENLLWGKVSHQNGERCRHTPPKSSLMGFINGNKDRLLTHNAPRWGSSDRNITGYGFFGLEWGNLGDIGPQDRLSFHFYCDATKESTTLKLKGEIFQNESSARKNIDLTSSASPLNPTQLEKTKHQAGEFISLHWKGAEENAAYHVYRRNYDKHGYYQRIAANLDQTTYTDGSIRSDEIYGYIVLAESENGMMSAPSGEVMNIPSGSFIGPPANFVNRPAVKGSPFSLQAENMSKVISLHKKLNLKAGGQESIRIVRGVARTDSSDEYLLREAKRLVHEPIGPYLTHNEEIYSDIPEIPGLSKDQRYLYWSAFSLMRQVMLPPEGQLDYNYYVFSREPTWGWGHGGQVFHESLTMLAYAYMDPMSAMNSQRVYEQVQHDNGYINYRTGSYLNEMIEVDGQYTTSAPWYAWQNWKIYQITGDKHFLKEMYASSKAFYNYYISTRDTDGDGLHEWGGHAVLESVRDAQVAVWDEVAWPANFEAVDLNTMLVAEEKALSKMAAALGKKGEAAQFRKKARERTKRINQTMWDSTTGFYYQVDKKDNDFTYKSENDLKRKEIIGFLPLWAGVASEKQAEKLVAHLTDTSKFWRKFGVPSLSADDPYYNPRGYWNGPVWVEWNYLIEHGLKKYGYHDQARELVDRVAENMILQLKKDHNLWEFYSPDSQWAGYHKTYIWAGIINRMLMDTYGETGPAGK
mgnify:CR=1 FL=1